MDAWITLFVALGVFLFGWVADLWTLLFPTV